ncbi:probable tubulin polyglutamylase ttll-15 [Drosophila pseudoobscura]|uniref:Probable tubulin polyglutamylase ttll-15 n=1 Tax=Drosophila pseudoobscura pseudoobscura TaxID=46245 RepID=A0A6I8WEV0_DROPS|nr:probable tubulin polyglutamylase ttll-15 [Drosophila pseudoobscura]
MESNLKRNSSTPESIMAKYAVMKRDEGSPEKPVTKYTGSSALRPIMLFLAAAAVTTSVLVALPRPVKNFILSSQNTSNSTLKDLQSGAPTYAIFGKSHTEEHLVHVVNVLHRFGYERVELNESWNLLWAHDYPFLSLPDLKNLGKHQKVNHFPGCGYLTNKVDLCTTSLPFLPRAFRLPTQRVDFLEYAHAHPDPDALFVEKHNEHRHIKVRKPSDIDLWSNDSFVQEFIPKPFLVDGHKFDIGVYVVITEINPLRVYIYTGDVLFRYCPVKYYPFDSENVDKYIVGDDYLPTWEVPSLRKYYNLFGGSMRNAFEAYVRDQSMDPSKIWPQVEHIIRTTILTKEKDIVNILHSYKQHNFFDLMRFDLFIDENLKVYLMEANMSPNLSSAHFKPNSLLYEQVLYSVFNLVGIRQLHGTSAPIFSDSSDFLASDKNLATALNTCASNDCDRNCNKEKCSLCLPCLSGSEYKMLHQAYEEHLHRVDMKRIFPKPILNLQNFDIIDETRNMSKKNAWMTRWFYNKCQYERTWCV